MTREDRIAAMERYWCEVMHHRLDRFVTLRTKPDIVGDVEADGTVSYDTLFEFQRLVDLNWNGRDRT